MATISFQERFKNRTAIVSNNGALPINPNSAVSKPLSNQVHGNVLKYTGSNVIKSSLGSQIGILNHSESSFYGSEVKAMSEVPRMNIVKVVNDKTKSPKRQQNQSAMPMRKKSNSSLDGSEIINKSCSKIDYKPYSLKDYDTIKPKTYYLLGGLGPSNIGTEDWTRKKELNDKRWNYSKDVYYANAAKLPLFPPTSPIRPQIIIDNSRARAIEFAKSIIRPPLKLPLRPS